jgi:hypothetical protein
MEYRFQPRSADPEREAAELSDRVLENYQYIHCSDLLRCSYARFLQSVIKHPTEPSQRSIRRRELKNEGVTLFQKAAAGWNSIFGDGEKQKDIDKKKAIAEEEARKKYNQAMAVYADEMKDYRSRLDYYEELLHQGDEDVTLDYFNYVLSNDSFSADTFSKYQVVADVFAFDKQTGTLEVDYRIPEADEIPALTRFVYDRSTGDIVGQPIANKKSAATHRLNFARALLLRAAATIHLSDEAYVVKRIVMNGYLYFGGTASGRAQKKLVIKAIFPCKMIETLSPEHVEIAKLFAEDLRATEVPGIYSKDPYELGEMPYVPTSKKSSPTKKNISKTYRLAKPDSSDDMSTEEEV